jgi:hypothetical protein
MDWLSQEIIKIIKVNVNVSKIIKNKIKSHTDNNNKENQVIKLYKKKGSILL